MKHLNYLIENSACIRGYEFCKTQPSLKEAWNNCQRGDWMLWLAYKLNIQNIDHKRFTLTKAMCAKTVYHLMKDKRSKNAIVACIKYSTGLITLVDLNAAADDAYAAFADAYAAFASNTSICVAYAAYAAVDDASYAPYTSITSSAAVNAVQKKNYLDTANICHKYLTKLVFAEIDRIGLNN